MQQRRQQLKKWYNLCFFVTIIKARKKVTSIFHQQSMNIVVYIGKMYEKSIYASLTNLTVAVFTQKNTLN